REALEDLHVERAGEENLPVGSLLSHKLTRGIAGRGERCQETGLSRRDQPRAKAPSLLQLDGDPVGRFSGSVLFRVLRRSGDANVVRLRVWLIVQVEDYPVQNV